MDDFKDKYIPSEKLNKRRKYCLDLECTEL